MCVNEKCNKHWDTPEKVLVTIDGDFACCSACAKEWEQQRDHFMNNILPDDKLYQQWLEG